MRPAWGWTAAVEHHYRQGAMAVVSRQASDRTLYRLGVQRHCTSRCPTRRRAPRAPRAHTSTEANIQHYRKHSPTPREASDSFTAAHRHYNTRTETSLVRPPVVARAERAASWLSSVKYEPFQQNNDTVFRLAKVRYPLL